MNEQLTSEIYKSFKNLIERDFFWLQSEINEDGYYHIIFASNEFNVRIEKYHRELYVSLYKAGGDNFEVNLFNLLEYLLQGEASVEKQNFLHGEKNLQYCYKNQIDQISKVIDKNYQVIKSFFGINHKDNSHKFNVFWKKKHPKVFKTLDD